ncbi:SHOCT domain-containing protein [Pseudonocardia hydrocarbonoxydans]|uniref:SHOCT domain-containing protein n=1 Tax=Pseudonocardia hydrocarbonoxydans TaxID=76726 RepID=UPI0031D76F22
MMCWYGPGTGGWGVGLMAVGVVLFWALIILGLIAVAWYLWTSADRAPQAQPVPEELLAERFARGEIDEQEYRQRLDTLHGRAGPVIRS